MPFRSDVHALFYSDDALATEAMLHRTFTEERVNRDNLRREFFRVTPYQVLEVLKEQHVELVEFTELRTTKELRLSTPEAEALPKVVDARELLPTTPPFVGISLNATELAKPLAVFPLEQRPGHRRHLTARGRKSPGQAQPGAARRE